jgi:hypothetical protein
MGQGRKTETMNTPLPHLRIQITKTADGLAEYVQILSGDQFSVNIVLIANRIDVADQRATPKIGRDTEKEMAEAIHRIYEQYGTNLQAFFDDVKRARARRDLRP